MIFKKKIIITLILVSFLLIGAVSAASNTNDTLSSDLTEKPQTHADTNQIDKTSNDDIKTDGLPTPLSEDTTIDQSGNGNNNELNENYDKTSFKELNKKINESTTDTIELDHDYVYNESSDSEFENGITISKSITIDGKGKTVDAKSKARIFIITTQAHIILKNLILTQGKGIEYGSRWYEGGAIYANHANITLINCTLTHNSAIDYGGAISADNSELNIIDSKFTNNTGLNEEEYHHSCNGGAICISESNLTIMNSNFTYNNVDGDGGAICAYQSQLNIINSRFTNNSAINKESNLFGSGGAISNRGNLTIINSNFTYNSATADGGAIESYFGILTIINSNLTNNIAKETGGAIYTDNEVGLTIINSNLTNNKLVMSKHNQGGYINLLTDEGLIDLLTNKFNVSILDVYDDDPVLINITGMDTNFNGDLSLNITNKFTNTIQSFNITIKNGEGSKTISLPIGKYTATFTKQIINNNGYSLTKDFTVMNKTSFTALYNKIMKSENNITLTHDYIYDSRTDANFKSGIPIINNFLIIGDGHIIDGKNTARIFEITNKANVTITNITLTHGKGCPSESLYKDVAGAIYSYMAKLTLINCIITHNNAGTIGGAIYAYYSKLNITNSNLTHNNADFGGAIYAEEKCNVTITCSNFTHNNAYFGGAIDAYRSQLNMTNLNFTQNKAQDGGAIHTRGSKLNITQATINNNTARSCGGAIDAESSHLNITNSKFTTNQVEGNSGCGGAIDAYRSQLNMVNLNFTQNKADLGGAIYTYGSQLNITKFNFKQNKAQDGGAIYTLESQLNITQSNFTQNNAYFVGAINASNCNLTITKTNFINNTIYISNSTADVHKCTFNASDVLGNDIDLTDSRIINPDDPTYENPSNTNEGNNGNNNQNTDTKSENENNTPKQDTTIPPKTGPSNKVSNKQNTKILANKKTFKTKVKTKKYTITLKSGKKGVPKVTVYLLLKGKKYKKTLQTTTNTKGKAIFKIKKLRQKGKYTATIKFKGNKSYKKSTKKVQITIK